MDRLSITFCGLKFENPFVLAATPCTDELEMLRNGFKAGWAGAVLKSTHSESIVFSPVSPMLKGWDFEEKKMVGLGNIDVSSKYHVGIVEERVQELKKEFPNKIIIVSVVGTNKETWQEPVKRLVAAGTDAIECSTGCPQGHTGLGGGKFLCENPVALGEMVGWVKEAAGSIPVFVKLNAEVDNVACANAVKKADGNAVTTGAVGIRSLMGINLNTFVPYPEVAGKSAYGGYHGPVTKPISLRIVSQVAKEVAIPIAACGGAATWEDVIEFMLVGATIVEFGSSVMRTGFRIVEDLKDGAETYLEDKNISRISDLIGKALPNIVTQDELSQDYRVVSSINRETCIKDDLCYIACRDGGHMALELDEERIPVVDEEKCVGCALCTTVCPVWDCVTLKLRTK